MTSAKKPAWMGVNFWSTVTESCGVRKPTGDTNDRRLDGTLKLIADFGDE
jgi:hypothetical protein